MLRIWNLTPHPCNYCDEGQNQRTIASDGNVRVNQVQVGDVVIVSTIVADALARLGAPDGVIVLVPDTGPTCKRDESGRIVAVRQFIRK